MTTINGAVTMSYEEILAFAKRCFYRGFDKCENDDANCFTAWREEAIELMQATFKDWKPE